MTAAEGAPDRFGPLLDVQEHDTATDQLVHRRGSLPEAAELADVERRVVALERRREDNAAGRGAVSRRLQVAEGELEAIESRISAEEARLYAGTVTVARELQALAEEIEGLRRRREVLEEAVIGLLTELEPFDTTEHQLLEERDSLDAEGTRLRAAVAEVQLAIDEDLAGARSQRAAAASGVDAQLLAHYEKVRGAKGGVGVAVLAGGRCNGCHLGLPAVEVERLRRLPPDELAHCDHCGRILVRR